MKLNQKLNEPEGQTKTNGHAWTSSMCQQQKYKKQNNWEKNDYFI